MFNLASSGWLVVLLFLFFSFSIGLFRRQQVGSGAEFLLAGRSMPGWVCAVAFAAAGLSAQEMLAMGAAGARFGLSAVWFFALGSVVSMLLAGLFLVPLYRRAGAATVPEFLGQRFGGGVRLVSAALLVLSTAAGAALSLAIAARLVEKLHLLDVLFHAYGWSRQGIFWAALVALAAFVAAYVLFAGLAATAVNQVVQFCVLLAGTLPAVFAGLNVAGGWSGLKAALPEALEKTSGQTPHSGWLLLAAGLVLGAGFWCVDMRPLQMALAAASDEEARRTPLLAAPLRLALAAVLVLAGAIAMVQPTPQSRTVEHEENGVIYHETTVVSRETSEGQGLVPVRLDAATRNPQRGVDGRPVLDTALALPNLLGKLLPAGLLGLGVAALLAALMSGLASSLSASAALVAHDIYLPLAKTVAVEDEPRRRLALCRWITAAGALLIAVLAGLVGQSEVLAANAVFDTLLLLLAVGGASLLATVAGAALLKRLTGQGVLAGLLAGQFAALLLYGLTLPVDAPAGLQGGWIAVAHRSSSVLEQSLTIALAAMLMNLIVATAVSFFDPAKSEGDPARAVKTPAKRKKQTGGTQKNAMLAALILALTITVCLLLA